MQAQARAMSADERELNKNSQSCDNYNDLGLPPGKYIVTFKKYRNWFCIVHIHELCTPPLLRDMCSQVVKVVTSVYKPN